MLRPIGGAARASYAWQARSKICACSCGAAQSSAQKERTLPLRRAGGRADVAERSPQRHWTLRALFAEKQRRSHSHRWRACSQERRGRRSRRLLSRARRLVGSAGRQRGGRQDGAQKSHAPPRERRGARVAPAGRVLRRTASRHSPAAGSSGSAAPTSQLSGAPQPTSAGTRPACVWCDLSSQNAHSDAQWLHRCAG